MKNRQVLVHGCGMLGLTLAVLTGVLAPKLALADCFDYEAYLHRLGHVDTPGQATSLSILGSFAYIADQESGLQVVNIANPSFPAIVGSVNTPGTALGVTVSSSYAYVADGSSGLQIIDVTNPASPVIVGTKDTPGIARAVAISGSNVCVADSSALLVISVSSPTSPVIYGNITTSGSLGVAVSSGRAYVTDASGNLSVIDIADPTSPHLVGSVHMPAIARGVAVFGTYAYVADDHAGLEIINITNPSSPTLVGSWPTPGSAQGVAVSGSKVFVADDAFGLQVIDVTNPASPKSVGSWPTQASALGVTVSGSNVYVAEEVDGLEVFAKMDASIVGRVNMGWASEAAVIGSRAYVTTGSGLVIMDITNPSSPQTLGSISAGGGLGVAVSGSHAYVAKWDAGIQVIDVSNPASPVIVGSVDTPGTAVDVAVSGNYAYVADGQSGLQVIDISNPASPSIVGNIGTRLAEAVAVSGSYAYVTDNSVYVPNQPSVSTIEVINVSNPIVPSRVRSIVAQDFVYGIAVAGPVACVANYGSGLLVIDISNPALASVVGSAHSVKHALGVAISGPYAYLADEGGYLQVVKISNPQLPAIVANVSLPNAASYTSGHTFQVAVTGSSTFVTDMSDFVILPAQCVGVTGVLPASFQASPAPGGILLEWAPLFESDVSGFQVERSLQPDAGYEQISPFIPASSPYQFLDTGVSPGTTYYYRLLALDRSGGQDYFGPVSAKADQVDILGVRLEQSRPNPFLGNNVLIPFTLARAEMVKLTILDLSGRQVRLLADQLLSPGEHTVNWDGRNDRGEPVAAGVYAYDLTTPGFRATRRLVRVR